MESCCLPYACVRCNVPFFKNFNFKITIIIILFCHFSLSLHSCLVLSLSCRHFIFPYAGCVLYCTNNARTDSQFNYISIRRKWLLRWLVRGKLVARRGTWIHPQAAYTFNKNGHTTHGQSYTSFSKSVSNASTPMWTAHFYSG